MSRCVKIDGISVSSKLAEKFDVPRMHILSSNVQTGLVLVNTCQSTETWLEGGVLDSQV